jgi:glycosyltransferase involved in cell wall biosynthesis
MKLSIVIPTLNEAGQIRFLLEDLINQRSTFDDFETLVVDAKSLDGTSDEVLSYLNRLPNLKLVTTEKGVAAQRNLGADQAKGEWILFLDADASLPAGFLKGFIDQAEAQDLTVATANFKVRSRSLIDQLGAWLMLKMLRWSRKSRHPRSSGSCMLVRADLHQKIGGFDPKLKLAEDHDYATRVVAAGGRFDYVDQPFWYASMRRFELEGRLRVFGKYIVSEIYRLIFKRIETDIFNYKFGGHKKPRT